MLPDQTSVVAAVPGGSYLTLTTCQPKGSARQRLVMRFELVKSVATGGAEEHVSAGSGAAPCSRSP